MHIRMLTPLCEGRQETQGNSIRQYRSQEIQYVHIASELLYTGTSPTKTCAVAEPIVNTCRQLPTVLLTLARRASIPGQCYAELPV